MKYRDQTLAMAMAFGPLLQTTEGGGGIPWWVWLVVISVLLLLLLIGFVRQSEPGEPLPKPEERVVPPAAANEVASEEPESETPAEAMDDGGEESGEAPPDKPEQSDGSAEEPDELEPAQADDLKKIEGIGPKIAALLDEEGIDTYAKLASTPPERLQELLDKANMQMADPETWPEQARLAAKADWAALEKLQGTLKGGRKE